MIDYQKMYATMFNAATDALEVLSHTKGDSADIAKCIRLLSEAQCKCEELYISAEDAEPV